MISGLAQTPYFSYVLSSEVVIHEARSSTCPSRNPLKSLTMSSLTTKADESAMADTPSRIRNTLSQSRLSILLAGETVPHAVDGQDQQRVLRIVFDLVPDVLDMGINA